MISINEVFIFIGDLSVVFIFSMIRFYNLILEKREIMLKSLLNKIKSQKSEALSSSKSYQSPNQQSKTSQQYQYINYPQLKQDIEIISQIRRIRYIAFDSYPNIYNKIVGCPISTFNILPYAKRKVKQIDLTKHQLPQYMHPLKQILTKQLPNYNHLLINIYGAGVGIMPHFDGPLYKSKVVVLSLGGPAIINFTDSYKNINKCAKLLLEDQSLHIFEQQAYVKYLHGIEQFTIDSIFIKVQYEMDGSGAKVIKSSIANFHLTRLSIIICKQFQLQKHQQQINELDLSKEVGYKCYVLSIKSNDQYNYKIQIVREQRISITIRQKINEKAQTF